jgi:hypothetical protein
MIEGKHMSMRLILFGTVLLASSGALAQQNSGRDIPDAGVRGIEGSTRPSAPDAGVVAPAFAVSGALGKGLTVSYGDAFSMTVKGRMALRDVVAIKEKSATNEVSLRTARVVFQGKALSPSLSYTLQLALGAADYEKDVTSPLYDAYVDFTALRDLRLRAGQFLVPFDRARTIRENSLQFVDRQQLISEINLDRDIGLSAFSDDFLGVGGRLSYALSVFGGQGKNRFIAVPEPVFLWVGRIAVRPMGPFDDDSEGDVKRSTSPHMAIGLAAAYNGKTMRQRSTVGNVLTTGTFAYTHAAADLVFKYGGFALLAEATYRAADRPFRQTTDASGKTTTEYSRTAWGYTVQASMMIGPMFELAARWNQLRAFGDTDPDLKKTVTQQGREVSAGFNVYLNGHLFKVQGDYTARIGEGNAPVGHMARVLLDLSL